jgi:hypothetical protein
MLDESCRVPGLPRLVRSLRRMAPVELHERLDEMASHRSYAEDLGKLRELEEPVGVPGGPVGIVSVRDPVDHVVGLGGLVEEVCNATSAMVVGHGLKVRLVGRCVGTGSSPRSLSRSAR